MAEFLLQVWRLAVNRWTRYVAAWVGVLLLAGYAQNKAIHIYDERDSTPENERRRDGNSGHVGIDFGGQWIMGRMLVLGHGRELYNRHRLYELAQQMYPREDEAPEAKKHDADELLTAFMNVEVNRDGVAPRETREHRVLATFVLPLAAPGPLEAASAVSISRAHFWTARWWEPDRLAELRSKHVGGPLYPPTQALIFAPLALTTTRHAYFIVQWIMLGFGFVGGAGVSALTRGRIWCPVAAAMIIVYPGFTGAHELGQNAPASLAIIVWGWVLVSRGYPTAGGLVWGLLAFKPVWAAAFLLVPVLTRRWRMAAAMCLVGAAMVAATLPFVGIESWQDWLKIGSVANRTYNVDGNWIPLSRDLLGIPRRWLITEEPGVAYFERDRWQAHVAGWALWLIVVELTVRLSQLYPAAFRATRGPAAAFLLLGAWLSCFHFMYYDVLLSAVAYFVMLDPPAALFRPRLLTIHTGSDAAALDARAVDYFEPRLATEHPGLGGSGTGRTWVANSLLIYFGLVLMLVQMTLPWLDATVAVSAGRYAEPVAVPEGAPARWHTPKLEVTTGTRGTPWDTLCLIFFWGWCGVRVIGGQGGPLRAAPQDDYSSGSYKNR